MSHKKLEYFYLSSKEEATMKVLWDTEEELSASEIAERIPHREWPASSIQSILRKLEQKGVIEVSSITKIGKSYGRLFRPTLSSNEYASMQFNRYYRNNDRDCLSILSSLLGNTSNSKEEIVKTLHSLLEEYEKRD